MIVESKPLPPADTKDRAHTEYLVIASRYLNNGFDIWDEGWPSVLQKPVYAFELLESAAVHWREIPLNNVGPRLVAEIYPAIEDVCIPVRLATELRRLGWHDERVRITPG